MSAMIHRRKSQASGTNRAAGNTLLEFLLAIAMFLVVAGGAFTLFGQSVPLFNQQQAAAGLNISLQNAVTEIQEDVVNAGTGYYTGANIPNWPIGVTIINQSDSVVCNVSATFTYTAGCFDTLNIITTDANTPPLHLGTTGACINTTSTSMIAQPPAGYTAAQIASLAGNFKSGDQLLLVKNDGSQMTTVKLTAGGSVSSGNILISINATNADGTNTATNDPLAITTHSNTTDNGGFSELGVQFCNADWVLRLQPTTYSVDLTNPNDPKLARTQNGVEAIVAEQIIGFRVGASLWNDPTDTDTQKYNYQASTFGTGYDFTLIRSIRASIIGRTVPSNSRGQPIQNSFDGGNYAILGAEIVVNPRNMSMGDN